MPEVKRITVFMHGPNKKVDMAEAAHLDRVTTERGAALALIKTHEDAMAHVLEREKLLQQRLTAADERVDVLEGLLHRWSAEAGGVFCVLKYETDAALKPAEGGGDA